MTDKEFRVLICDGMVPEGLAVFEAAGGFEAVNRKGIEREELLKIIPEYDAVVIRSATRIEVGWQCGVV